MALRVGNRDLSRLDTRTSSRIPRISTRSVRSCVFCRVASAYYRCSSFGTLKYLDTKGLVGRHLFLSLYAHSFFKTNWRMNVGRCCVMAQRPQMRWLRKPSDGPRRPWGFLHSRTFSSAKSLFPEFLRNKLEHTWSVFQDVNVQD